jgi:hypothetical protein
LFLFFLFSRQYPPPFVEDMFRGVQKGTLTRTIQPTGELGNPDVTDNKLTLTNGSWMWVVFRSFIREVPGSNLVPKTGYPDLMFVVGFLSPSRQKPG